MLYMHGGETCKIRENSFRQKRGEVLLDEAQNGFENLGKYLKKEEIVSNV